MDWAYHNRMADEIEALAAYSTAKKKWNKNHAKHHKLIVEGERVGRLTRAEKKYRKTKTHVGKGKNLRSHRQ